MKRGGLVIGLGGAGLRVAARLRQVLAQEGRGRLPDHIRLLALDQQKPAPGTGKLPQAHHFLIQLPPLEESDASGISQRRAARQALLNDLALGAISSQILRGLAAPLDALRRVGMKEVEVFLVSSTFGSTGSAWLVDVAYLLRHLTYNRMRARIHVVLITPEAFERGFFPSEEQTLVHQATLKELDWLQRARDWGAPLSLYEDRHLGSLPGRLTSRPFHSVQVVDAKDLNTSLDAGAVPAAAEAILCQLDDQTAAVLEEAALLEPAVDAPPFATLGVFTLLYPVRLMMDQTVQRLILSSIESFFPLHKNPDTGRPERLTEPVHLRSDSPYGKLHAWIPEPNRSGILQDVLRESAALQSRVLGDRAALRSEMEQRTPEIWKSVFFQCDGAQDLVPADWSLPEPLDRLGRRHVRVFLQQLVARLNAPDERLGAPLEYLHKLEQALAAYLQDLDTVVENWRQRGEHSETESLRRALDEARGEMESRRSSLLGRLVPQTSQGAQERFIKARQLHAHYRQREAVVEMVQQTATVMRVLTHRLLTFGQKSLHALALLSDSAFNVAFDQSQRLERELRFENAVRVQQLVVDTGFETRQSRLVYAEFEKKFAAGIQETLMGLESALEWPSGDVRLGLQVADPALHDQPVDLDDADLSAERMAALVYRALAYYFGEALINQQPDNSVTNFLSYLDPRADRLAGRLADAVRPQARTITPVQPRRTFLYSPRTGSALVDDYARGLLSELQIKLGDVYVLNTFSPDRLTLFTYYGGLNLDNLVSFHQYAPRKADAGALKPYLLWHA